MCPLNDYQTTRRAVVDEDYLVIFSFCNNVVFYGRDFFLFKLLDDLVNFIILLRLRVDIIKSSLLQRISYYYYYIAAAAIKLFD